MNPKHRPLLALLLLVFVSLACIPGTKKVVGEVTCVDEGYAFGLGTQYQCYCPLDGKAYSNGQFSGPELRKLDPTVLKEVACTDYFAAQPINQDPALNLAPTEPPTEEPTEEPAPTEPPLTSILGGRVSYCSVNAGQNYLNLPFNSGADPAQVQQELDSGALKVVISGTTTEGRCKVLASNNMLLCAYPSGSFPAFSSSATNTILNVVHNGTIIDVLPFNNYCEGLQSVNGGGGESSTEENGGSGGSVPACDPHSDPTCPVDCTNPVNADLCG